MGAILPPLRLNKQAALARASAAFPGRIKVVQTAALEECPAMRSGRAMDVGDKRCAAANATMADVFRWLGGFQGQGNSWGEWDGGYLTLEVHQEKGRRCSGAAR